jgi:hypothetical protein
MGKPHPLSYRELRKKLKKFGVEEKDDGSSGKGSHRILILPETPGANRGPQISVRCHGEGDEISAPVIKAVLRRFEINSKEFWK